jgi:DNA-binding MarR family transcriptional regulator
VCDENQGDGNETRQLAMRFLGVFHQMMKFEGKQKRNEIVGKLHLNQLQMLGILNHVPGMNQKDLAERLQLTPPAISNSIREMERFGLVKRQHDPGDARVLRLYLSEEGQKLFDEHQEMRCRGMAELLSALPLAEQNMIVEALERAVAARSTQDQTNYSS